MADLPESFKDIELIVLDMDGVVTSEQSYWDVAGLVVREIIESPAFLGLSPPDYTPVANLFYQKLAKGTRLDWRKYLPPELIKKCKIRGINSNWDLTYIVAGLYLAPLLAPVIQTMQKLSYEDLCAPAGSTDSQAMKTPLLAGEETPPEENPASWLPQLKDELSPVWDRLCQSFQQNRWHDFLQAADFHLWGSFFRKQKHTISPFNHLELLLMDDFHPDIKGLRLLDELNHLLIPRPRTHLPIFGRNTTLWDECRDLFQGWYLGEDLYQQIYGRPLAYTPKPGLIHKEEPLHGRENTHSFLGRLKKAGYRLAIATGRPRMEIIKPLERWNLLSYFDEDRIVTYDEVENAEKELQKEGISEKIVKPHPYSFLKAIFPEKSCVDIVKTAKEPVPDIHKVLIVGDAQADIWAARTINCPSVAVLSGAIGPTSRRQLEEAHPDLLCENILELTRLLCS